MPTDVLQQPLALLAQIQRSVAAFLRALSAPPNAGVQEIAQGYLDVIEMNRELTEKIQQFAANVRQSSRAMVLAEDEDLSDDDHAMLMRFITLVERALEHDLPQEMDETHPLARVSLSVLRPYNDAVRDARRAVADCIARARSIIAQVEAEDAADIAAAEAAIREGGDPAPWEDVERELFADGQ